MRPFSELETRGQSFARVGASGAVSVSSRVYPASGPGDAEALLAARGCVTEFALLIASQEADAVGASAGVPVVVTLGAGGELGDGLRGLHLTIPLYLAGGGSLSADVVVLVGSSGEATVVYSLYSVGEVFDAAAVGMLARLLAKRTG